MYTYSFQTLNVYQLSIEFVSQIYELTSNFPKEEKYGMISQMNRAALSVSLNIAEGNDRKSSKEKRRYIEISYGSLMEVVACLDVAHKLQFISQEEKAKYIIQINELSNKLRAFQRSV